MYVKWGREAITLGETEGLEKAMSLMRSLRNWEVKSGLVETKYQGQGTVQALGADLVGMKAKGLPLWEGSRDGQKERRGVRGAGEREEE